MRRVELLDLRQRRGGGQGARHPLQAWLQGRSGQRGRRSLAPGAICSGGGQRRGDHPLVGHAVPGKPRRQGVLAVGQDQRIMRRRGGLDLAAQGVERDELLGRDLFTGEPARTREQRLACGLQVVHRPGRGRCRVVDLVGEAGRELAQGDQGLALPRGRTRWNARCGKAPR